MRCAEADTEGLVASSSSMAASRLSQALLWCQEQQEDPSTQTCSAQAVAFLCPAACLLASWQASCLHAGLFHSTTMQLQHTKAP